MSVVNGKVALVTGGATGIGLEYVKELLRNGSRGILIADINVENGRKVVNELEKQFGQGKVVFQKTDVTNKDEFENAFKVAVDKFKNLDIVINNAGILNDQIWEKQIDINTKGVVNGSLLAIHNYLPKYMSGNEAYLVNVASILGLDYFNSVPVYSGTKHFVVGFSKSLGCEIQYQKTKVKILIICPGVTETTLIEDMENKTLGDDYLSFVSDEMDSFKSQTVPHMAKGLMEVLGKRTTSGSVWVIEGGEPPYEINHLNREQRRKI